MSVQEAVTPPGYPRRPVARLNPVQGYGVGMWAWLLQRVTAVLLVVVVFAHFWFNVLFPSWGTLRIATDLTLITLVTYHAFSGIRTVLVDFGFGIRTQRAVFFGTVVLALLTAAAALKVYSGRFM